MKFIESIQIEINQDSTTKNKKLKKCFLLLNSAQASKLCWTNVWPEMPDSPYKKRIDQGEKINVIKDRQEQKIHKTSEKVFD